MTEENDSFNDAKRWDYFWNNPDTSKREAFRLWNTNPNSLTKQQRLLITELFKEVST
tara:strand:- start:892 stop:1062 length:171 start_codon:yes stop_codon:yes gene_type:complete